MPPWLDPQNAAIRRRLTFSAPAIWLRWHFIELTASRDRAEGFNAVHLLWGASIALTDFFRTLLLIFLTYAYQFLSRLISFSVLCYVSSTHHIWILCELHAFSKFSSTHENIVVIYNIMNIHKIFIGRWLSIRIIILLI